jgi:formylglycine-generating enzyme required for sulfatase activity
VFVGGAAIGGIFISHSSKNSAEAERLRDWLEEQGWGRSQVFLDLQDLKSGDSWRDVLNAMGDKEAVIVCLSNEWLGSHECVREFTQAQERGKPILPIFVAPVTVAIPRFITDLQIGDGTKEDGFQSLRDSLLAKRITPQSFAWPPPNDLTRSVYRGLQALDVQDAAIFFGRDADIARGLDELRRLRSGAPQRLLVILGASGAGKSSFLRAGLLARLRRDEENFCVLPIVRPERAAISGAQGLAPGISTALGRAIPINNVADLASAFAELRRPVVERLARNAAAAGETHTAKPPTLIIPLDQAEELFGADNAERAKFCEIVSEAIAQDGNALLVVTIRSDSYENLQNGLMPESQNTFSLPAIAAGAFKEIIEGPAKLAKPSLSVEPELTQRLLADLNAADALPLLAFTLERLQSQFGAGGKLTLTDYRDKLGGLSGAIQSAVNAVMGAQPSKSDLALARRLFVPSLVQVDQDGVKRRVARRQDLPADAQALADRFVAQRLLVTDAGAIEVTHEAILRQWPALSGWIAEDEQSLLVLDGVRAAAQEWATRSAGVRRQRSDRWLSHSGQRLKEARSIAARVDFAQVLDANEHDYITACEKHERRQSGRRRLTTTIAVVAALAVQDVGLIYVGGDVRAAVERWWNYGRYAHLSAELMAVSPGTQFRDCRGSSTDCPLMVVIPDGTFLMGDPPGVTFGAEMGRPSEITRLISIARFAVSQNEISFIDWQKCVAGGGCRGAAEPHDAGWGRGSRPVINVSWEDATDYTHWLSTMTGQEYRLLSEAEWEYAARAGATADAKQTAFSWGDIEPVCSPAAANGAVFGGCPERMTFPVGSFRSNLFGLHDMHGNVWEWVQDCYAPYDPGQRDGGAVELEVASSDRAASSCDLRVSRGGAFYNDAVYLLASERRQLGPGHRHEGLGFRVARTL